ncbi:MAG: hypothetical protein AAF655_11270 [Bacteroidota bacterium]
MAKLKKVSKKQLWCYFILVARCLLACTFLGYGLGKLAGGQFGISEEELLTPIKELSLFKIGWYLFDFQPFKTFIGLSQVLCAVLLLWNRTVILGAFLFIPIALNILIIDITIMPPSLKAMFTARLSLYLLWAVLILWYYRDRLKVVWEALWSKVQTQISFPIWMYVSIPLAMMLLEFGPAVFMGLLFEPAKVVESFSSLFSYVF